MKELLHKFERFIADRRLVRPNDAIVLAVSGGVDSIVMLRLFIEIQRSWGLSLSVAHVNHRLRGSESDADEQFVLAEADRCGIPSNSVGVDVADFSLQHHVGTQEAARILRYRALESIRLRVGATAVATAHHADDNAETVLYNSMRGTGIRGLAGIPATRDGGTMIRPLLFARRSEIEAFANEMAISFREDSSNRKVSYRRNYLRHVTMPALDLELEADTASQLVRLANAANALKQGIETYVAKKLAVMGTSIDGSFEIDRGLLISEPVFLQQELLLEVLRQMSVEPSAERIERCFECISGESGHWVPLAGDVIVAREQEKIVFLHGVQAAQPVQQEVVIAAGTTERFENRELQVGLPEPNLNPALGQRDTEIVDASMLQEPLKIRYWKEGDWFIPLGMSGKKKLSDFFIDEKIPLREKMKIPVLTSGEHIVWVVGKRLDDRFKITQSTTTIVKLSHHLTV